MIPANQAKPFAGCCQLGVDLVDFGEFHAMIAGVLIKLWMFVMRLSCSGRAFHVAFATQAQEAPAAPGHSCQRLNRTSGLNASQNCKHDDICRHAHAY